MRYENVSNGKPEEKKKECRARKGVRKVKTAARLPTISTGGEELNPADEGAQFEVAGSGEEALKESANRLKNKKKRKGEERKTVKK